MALVLADRVQETTTTTGTGTVTLAGAVSGFQSFSVVGNGNTTFYTIVDSSAGDWEVGLGTYTSSGTTLARTTVLASSNSGSLVNFGAGTKQVFVTYPASQYGNVVGAASGTDNAFVRFDGATGRLIQNSNYATLDDNGKATFADQVYVQAIGAGYAQIVFEKVTGGAGTLTLRPSTSQSGNVTLVFPTSAGSSGQALTTDGTGVLAWTTVGGGGGAFFFLLLLGRLTPPPQ